MNLCDINGNIIPIEITSKLKSLKCGILGDSITEGTGASTTAKSYASLLSAEFASLENKGIGGSCISQHWQKPFVGRWNNLASNLDFVIVFGGVNDFYANAPIGDTDSTANTDFKGALNTIISGLLTKYPTKRLMFITPPQTNNGTLASDQPNGIGKTMQDYVDAIKERCNHYSIPCFDLFANSGVNVADNATQKTAMTADGIHPNDAGHQRIYELVLGFCKNLVGE